MPKVPISRRIGTMLSSSCIVGFFVKLATVIYRKLEAGLIGGIFTAYDRENEALQKSFILGNFTGEANGSKGLLPLKRRISRGFEESIILGKIREKLHDMLYCQMKAYGLFTFSFALYSILAQLLKYFLNSGNSEYEFDVFSLITVVLMVIAAVGMISSRCTLAEAILGSRPASFLIIDVVGVRREILEKQEEHQGRLNQAFVLGTVFGVISYFTGPVVPIIGIFALTSAYLILQSPEFGVFAIITVLPFAPTMMLVAAVIYTAFCYVLKLICGKRSLKFDIMDVSVLLFMLLMIFGGIVAVSSGSIKPMLVYVTFMTGYFLVVNLIRTTEWMKKCVIGLTASSVAVAFYGLYQNFFGTVEQTWQDSDMFSEIEGRVVSTFENPNVLAEYLIMVIPLVFTVVLLGRTHKGRFVGIISVASLVACLVYTWSRGAWLGIILGMIVFLLMYSKNTMTAMFFGVLAIPLLPAILPSSIVSRFASIGNLSDSSTSYRVFIWRGVLNMLKDYAGTGIGIGYDSFKLVYPAYAFSAIESAPHSHNLYLQIVTELGVIGLAVFLIFIFLYAQSSFSIHANDSRKEKLISSALFCGIVSVLVQGMTDYIWYNYRVFLAFWLFIGLGVAMRKLLVYNSEKNIF